MVRFFYPQACWSKSHCLTFMGDTNFTLGKVGDALVAAAIIGGIATVPDISHLSQHSAVGLAILSVTFLVIAYR